MDNFIVFIPLISKGNNGEFTDKEEDFYSSLSVAKVNSASLSKLVLRKSLTFKNRYVIIIWYQVIMKEGVKMILQWIYNRLRKKAFKERHSLLKLQWERAKLEKKLRELKECAGHEKK